MDKNLKIFTSYVSKNTIDSAVKNNYLPLFVIRNISKSDIIGCYNNTVIHLKELSPSYELFQDYKYNNLIDEIEFERRYLLELSRVGIGRILDKVSEAARSCNAEGLVFMTFGKDESDYRDIFSDFLEKFLGVKINKLI